VILTIGCVGFIVTGFILGFMANKHRQPGAPRIPSFNPAHWVLPWKITDWFTPKGIKYYYTSHICIMLGLAFYILANGLPSLFK
jgi:hypothetical protein